MVSQPNEVQVTLDSDLHCNSDCYMIADVTNHIYTHDTNGKTSDSQATPATTTYVIFRAYSITSAYVSNGVCTTSSGGAITLSSPFSVLKPATSYDQQSFRNSARSKFQSYLGLVGCSAGGTSATPTAYVQVVHTANATNALPRMSIITGLATSTISVHLSTSIASDNSTSQLRQSTASSPVPSMNLGSGQSGLTNSPHRDRSTNAKIIIGVIVPLAFVAIILICAFCVYKNRARACRQKACSYDDIDGEEDSLPYLQQKAELGGDQCRHEMPAEHKRHEVEAEEMRHQLQADERRPELEACHFRHELEAPTKL